MTLQIFTARIGCRDADVLDVTRAGAEKRPGPGSAFAPSRALLNPYIARRRAGRLTAADWQEYSERYREEMRQSYRANRAAWDALLARDRVVLACYCVAIPEIQCHRVLLARILEQLGAVYGGELAAKVGRAQLLAGPADTGQVDYAPPVPVEVGQIPGLRTTPWDHQRRAIAFAAPRRGTLLAIHMGGGKTLVSIALAHLWSARRVLVTCPLAVVGVWPREFERHSTEPWTVARLDRGSIVERTARAAATLSEGAERTAIVCNHEISWREPFRSWALRQRWDLLIVDECHRGRAAGGVLSRFLHTLSRQVPRRLGLSGTPLPRGPLNAYGQARFIDPTVFGTRYADFREQFAITDPQFPSKVLRYQNLDEFEAKLATFCIRIPQAECIELPPEQNIERRCQLEPRARKIYDALEADFVAELETGEITAANAMVSLLRLEQLVGGAVRTDAGVIEVVSTAKRALLEDTLEDLPIAEPIIVFARFVADLDVILDVGKKSGRRVAELSGRCKDGLTAEATMRPDVDLLACQLQAGGVGVDLTRSATAIYYSRGWSGELIWQSRARLHRPGQTRKTTFIDLVAEDTIDAVAVRALAAREDMINGVLLRMTEHQRARGVA